MAEVPYVAMPIYGCEPYLDNDGAGGATVTGDNLIITAWTVEDKGGTPPDAPFTFESILVPNYVNDTLTSPSTGAVVGGVQSAAAKEASRQGMYSRHSGLMYIQSQQSGGSTRWPVLLVLNPPPEYKQQMAYAVEYNGGDTALYSSYTVNKPLQGNYAWRLLGSEAEQQNAPEPAVQGAQFSTYLPNVGISDTLRTAFLKTNGADGVTPEFFDAYTAEGVREMIAAVNRGEFYIAYVVTSESDIGYAGVVWPHSAARG